MSDLLIGALTLLLATNRPAALSEYVSKKLAPLTGTVAIDPNDPLEIEFQALLKADDDGEDEIENSMEAGSDDEDDLLDEADETEEL